MLIQENNLELGGVAPLVADHFPAHSTTDTHTTLSVHTMVNQIFIIIVFFFYLGESSSRRGEGGFGGGAVLKKVKVY